MVKSFCLFLSLTFCVVVLAYAEQPKLQGDIDISIDNSKDLKSWERGQRDIKIALEGLLNDLEDGNITDYIPDLGGEALHQLSSAYLFCSQKQGPCVFILDTILELEILRSVKNDDISCQELKYFWKDWLDSNYDKQLKYNLKLGFIDKFNDFNANQIKKYVKCEDTIKDVYRNNYFPSKEKIQDIKKTLNLIKLLGRKLGDVSSLYNAQNKGE